jgi:hypothetical protein
LASFMQWSRAMAKEGAQPRRVTWLHGAVVLREEAIARIRTLVPGMHVAVTAGGAPEFRVWDSCLQLPHPGEHRIVVVRAAQRLSTWDVLASALSGGVRDTAGLWLVFSSDEQDCYQRKDGKVVTSGTTKVLHPGPAAVSALASGQLVRCALSSHEDQIAWVQSRLPGLPATVAWRIIERTGADLAQAASVCAHLRFWGPGERTEQAVRALTPQEPAQEFAEALAAGRKDTAMRAIPASTSTGAALAQLGHLLDHLAVLYSASLQQLSVRDTVKLGVPQVVAVKYRKAAMDYPPGRVLSCRALLAEADAAWRSGAGDGVAEAVAALW